MDSLFANLPWKNVVIKNKQWTIFEHTRNLREQRKAMGMEALLTTTTTTTQFLSCNLSRLIFVAI